MIKTAKQVLWGVVVIMSLPAHAFDIDDIFGGGDSVETADMVDPIPASSPDTGQKKMVSQPGSWKFSRVEKHRQWALKCVKHEHSGNEKCNLIHQINSQQGQQILKIEILRTVSGGNQKQMLFHLPLGIYLPAGAVLKVGEVEEKMVIQTCLPAGCQARIDIGVNLHQAFRKAEKGIVQLLNQNRQQKINIEFSLLGYSKGVEGVL